MKQEIELARAYFTGDGVPQDAAQAAHWYERAAQAGDPNAQNEIGYMYQAGIGVPLSMDRATHWFQLAAASGSPQGSLNLGVAYLAGRGVPQNGAMAVTFITEAFHRGSGIAATYLGDMNYFGISVPQDKAAAEKWYESGLKLHDTLAAYRLGSLYSVAQDHVHDLRKAVGLLRISADGGCVLAMHSLGYLLVNYPNLAKSPQEAQPLLEEAANDGNWRSSVMLGILARNGVGTQADLRAAYFHFLVAVRQGGQQALDLVATDLRNIGAKFDADQLAKLTTEADTWSAQHNQALLYVEKHGKDRSEFPTAGIAIAPPGAFIGELLPLTSLRPGTQPRLRPMAN